MNTDFRRPTGVWQFGERRLETGRRTLVMGVVNVTPDSFSDGGRYLAPERAVGHALRLLDEGADVIDVGAESTRPGTRTGTRAGDPAQAAVSAAEEQDRLLPVIEGLRRARPDALISVDTYKAATARAAVMSGAEIVNDVSGLLWDEAMAATCAELRCGVVLMHTRGRPEEWANLPALALDAVLAAVEAGLAEALTRAAAAGIAPEAIVLDPGYGFGKKLEENFALLAGQSELLRLGRPLLAGLSRKSFLRCALTRRRNSKAVTSEDLEVASVAGLVAAILAGASVVRVHDARSAAAAAAVADALPDQVGQAARG
uniref:dihydropteroate synthase n=1 Tax=mine drainage metagenome TaxID=410659 RepID=E6PWM2_9ZZZZ